MRLRAAKIRCDRCHQRFRNERVFFHNNCTDGDGRCSYSDASSHAEISHFIDASRCTLQPLFFMNRFRVTVDGRTHDVIVEVLDDINPPARPLVPTAALPLETAAMSFGPPPHVLHAVAKDADSAGAVLSPLAGKVVAIDVQLGATVVEGAQVATIEAMKMNTYVFAPVAGKVTSIDARSGDAVEEGAVLLRLT